MATKTKAAAPSVGPTTLDTIPGRGIAPTESAIVEALGIPTGLIEAATDEDVMASILAQIANAGSVEEALASGVTEGLSDFAGHVLKFLDFRYQPSDFNPVDGKGVAWPFVVCKVTDVQGEVHTVTTGAKQVVVMLAFARKRDALPFDARVELITFETPEGETRHALKLVTP
jgi:hypothetical protein